MATQTACQRTLFVCKHYIRSSRPERLILKRRQLLKRQLLTLLLPVELAGRKPDGCTDM